MSAIISHLVTINQHDLSTSPGNMLVPEIAPKSLAQYSEDTHNFW